MGKRYKIVVFSVKSIDKHIMLHASHSEVTEWLYNEIKRLEPSALRHGDKNLAEGYSARIDRLQGHHFLISCKIRQQLCDDGWEPLDFVTFRKIEETTE